MKRGIILWMVLLVPVFFASCNNSGKKVNNKLAENTVVQRPDGTISLSLDKAQCYNDVKDPSANTAEWDVVVSRSGRYDVWLTSKTNDTSALSYTHDVRISVQDIRLEGHPGHVRIVRNSPDVSYPYFRADSFMGSMYIQDTGKFNVQVICEKILPADDTADKSDSGKGISKLISVSFTPVTR